MLGLGIWHSTQFSILFLLISIQDAMYTYLICLNYVIIHMDKQHPFHYRGSDPRFPGPEADVQYTGPLSQLSP